MRWLLILALLIPSHVPEFYQEVNEARFEQGLEALDWSVDMAFHAAVHNEDMAEADMIFHSQSWELGQFLGVRVAENVGRGQSVESLMEAFMDSPGHRAAILDPDYTHVGIATLHDDPYLYVTMVFQEAGPPAPAPPGVYRLLEVRFACLCDFSIPPQLVEGL